MREKIVSKLYINLKYKNILYRKMFFLFILIIVIPALILGVVASGYSLNVLVDKSSASYGITTENLTNTLESELFETKMIAYYMYLDLDLKEAIQVYNEDPVRSLPITNKVKTKFDNYKISANFNSVNVIKVYGFNGFTMSFGETTDVKNLDDEKIVLSSWYDQALENPDDFIWTGLTSTFAKVEGDNTISIFRVLQDRSYTENIGMLYVNLDPQMFRSLADKFSYSETSEIYILDNNNNALSTKPIPSNMMKQVENNMKNYDENYKAIIDLDHEKYFINYISEYDWKVIGVLPVDEITSSVVEVFQTIAFIFIMFLIVASIIWFIALGKLFVPIKELTKATKDIRKGDFTIQVSHKSNDELGTLANNFNFMVQKINTLMSEVVEENSKIKDAEYKALQAQINPHFLYNTLNSIRWMAIIQKADNIKNVVDVLGRLLRNSTSKMDQYITVFDELNNLKDYVYIQRIAYNNKFNVEYEIEPDVLEKRCLKFVLQPLVENAIFHGILPKEFYGTIWVKCSTNGDHLYFEVKDDGVGMSTNEIEKMLNKESEQSKKFNGIGIHSVRERIQMSCDNKAVFDVTSDKGKCTKINLMIPLTQGEII